MHDPAQTGDVELLVDRLVALDHLRQRPPGSDAVLVAPAGLRDQPLRLARRARRRAAPPTRRCAGHQHVVAEELELVPQPLLQLRQRRVVLVLQEVHLQPDRSSGPRGAARATSRTSGSGRGSTRSGSDAAVPAREEHLVEMRGQADAGRIGHRVERAPLLVLERLQPAQEEERARPTGRRLRRRPRAIAPLSATLHLLEVRVHRRRRRRRRRRTSCPAYWSTHGPVNARRAAPADRAPRRPALSASDDGARPTGSGAAAHRRDPLALGHVLPPRGERFLDLPNRGRVLEDGVVAGAVGQATL